VSVVHYFAYGSNMRRSQIQERCPGANLVGPARLRGHALDFTRWSDRWGGGVADVIAAADGETWGGLYVVTQRDLDELDKLEGHPRHYQRQRLLVEPAAGEPVDAWVYVVVAKAPRVLPTRAYWQAIVEGALDCGLPGDYVAKLRALEHAE